MISFYAAKHVEYFTMLYDGEWWACERGLGDLEFAGDAYRKVGSVAFRGFEGQVVLGYWNDGVVSLVRDDLMMAHHLDMRGVVSVLGYTPRQSMTTYNAALDLGRRRVKMVLPKIRIENSGSKRSPIYKYTADA